MYSQEKSDDLVSSVTYMLCPAEKDLENSEVSQLHLLLFWWPTSFYQARM